MRRIIAILTITLCTLCFGTNDTTAHLDSASCKSQPTDASVQAGMSIIDFLYLHVSNKKNDNHANNVHSAKHKQLRYRKMQEFTTDMKRVVLQLSSLDTLSAIELGRSFHSIPSKNYTLLSCDYYVFALRRILI